MHYYPEFKKSAPFTIGIEVELQLLNEDTLDLHPSAPSILDRAPVQSRARLKPEFIKSMIEVTTGVCNDIAEAEDDLRHGIHMLERLADRDGSILFASSLHPFASYSRQELSDDVRYRRLMDEFQIVGRMLITQGLHVHIGLDDPDRAIEVVDKMRIYIPMLLAISASSPFFEGQDTGLCSFRSKLFDALPRSGIADPILSWENFQVLADLLHQAGIIKSARDIWWDIRPNPIFGTVEVRICDVPGRFREMIAIASLIRVLVEYCLENRHIGSRVHRSILLNNKWNACRHGLKGIFVNPFSIDKMTIHQALLELLDDLEDLFDQLGLSDYFQEVLEMIHRGCSANIQREILKKKGGDFRAMIRTMREAFWT